MRQCAVSSGMVAGGEADGKHEGSTPVLDTNH